MPTYEYACRDCGGHLEVVQSFSDAPLTECPACEGSLRKVFSAAGLIFKGSGWHIKDYAGSNAKASSKHAGSSEGTGTGDAAASAAKGSDPTPSSAPAATATSSSGAPSASGASSPSNTSD